MRSSSPHSHFHSEMQVTLVLGKLLQLYLKVQSCLIVVEGPSLSCVSSFATRMAKLDKQLQTSLYFALLV